MCSRLDSYADPCSYLESEALEPSFVDPEESQPDAENQYSTDYEESSLHDSTPAETTSTSTRSWRTVPKEAKCILFFFQVQDLGLQADYNNDRGTYVFIRKVMALPFLPAEQIPAMYRGMAPWAESPRVW